MTRGADTTAPTRTCVGCGRRDAQRAMLRLRRDGGAAVVADACCRTGRSAYVHARPECVRGLMRSKGLGRSLRTTVAREARLELVKALEGRLASGASATLPTQPDARTEA